MEMGMSIRVEPQPISKINIKKICLGKTPSTLCMHNTIHVLITTDSSTPNTTQFGNSHEEVAVDKYLTTKRSTEPKISCREFGLLDPGWGEASLDRIVVESTGEEGLEVKCPLSNGETVDQIVKDKTFCQAKRLNWSCAPLCYSFVAFATSIGCSTDFAPNPHRLGRPDHLELGPHWLTLPA
ncbi:hypothetical protein Bbelb_111690 [Branchiostoma belcheri]|nr:hypothetical protein Bbelb_111690 [Branchiostoma belcheri]